MQPAYSEQCRVLGGQFCLRACCTARRDNVLKLVDMSTHQVAAASRSCLPIRRGANRVDCAACAQLSNEILETGDVLPEHCLLYISICSISCRGAGGGGREQRRQLGGHAEGPAAADRHAAGPRPAPGRSRGAWRDVQTLMSDCLLLSWTCVATGPRPLQCSIRSRCNRACSPGPAASPFNRARITARVGNYELSLAHLAMTMSKAIDRPHTSLRRWWLWRRCASQTASARPCGLACSPARNGCR